MGKIQSIRLIGILGLLVALIIMVQPVSAVNGTISITSRGSGGNYIGDNIVFDGFNSFGNVTLIKITGPGLPAEGVPVYDMHGQAGSGNIIPMNDDGSWKYVWYTGSIKNQDKLQTGRYYITVFDLTYPEKTASLSLLLKKPDFYVDAIPNVAVAGDYIQLVGIVEKGSTSVRFDLTDSAGKLAHSYETSVSASGYYNQGFHVDMAPGIYTITLTSPSSKAVYRNYLTVQPAGTPQPSPVTVISTPAPAGTVVPAPVTTSSPPLVAGTGRLSLSSAPSGATVYVDSVMVGTTPMEVGPLAPGNHGVEIKAPGYLTYSVQVTVKPDQTTDVSPVLLKNPSPLPLSLLTVIAGLLISFAVVIAGAKRRRD